ncbi:hypothetical protein BC829DRAFT_237166 [Chytridium lagenaria]|nr:hypothetical protein BC829DRAFT_237166 [Chytridium lagenaria]
MDEVRKLADLLHHLVKEGNVSEADVLKSFGDVLEMIDDISIDIPAVFKFMGVLYGRLLTLESSSFTLSNFFEALEPMFKAEERKKIADGPKLVAEAFLTIASCESEDFLQKMVKENPFDLKQIFPIASRTDEAVAIWMESNKLFFLNPLLKVTWGLRVKLGDSEAALAFLKQDEVAALEKE